MHEWEFIAFSMLHVSRTLLFKGSRASSMHLTGFNEHSMTMQLEMYSIEIEEMQRLTKEEYLASLRRQSSGFSRGVSKYRGVAR